MVDIQTITSRLISPSIRLFKALPIEENKGAKHRKSMALVEHTIKRGFVFAPEVLDNYEDSELMAMIGQISDEIGLTPEQMNAAFHKSWEKVRDAPMFQ